MKKTKFPSKAEVLKTIVKENSGNDYLNRLILIIEHKKINSKLAIIKGELHQNNKIILKGSMTCFPQKSEDGFNWDSLNAGESIFSGFSLDFKSETLGAMITQGIRTSIKEGKIPFIKCRVQ